MSPNSKRLRQALEMVPCRIGLAGQSDYQKFVIIGSRRTGTNFLLHLLRSSAQVVGFAELFAKVGPFWAGRSHSPLSPTNARSLRDRQPDRFLDEAVFRRYPSDIHAVGFKAHYGQLEAFPAALEMLQLERDLVVLHIRRTNLLAMEVSRSRARATGSYLQAPGDTATDGTKVRLDVHNIIPAFESYESNADWPHEQLPNAQTINISYENLAQNTVRAIRPVAEALGLPQIEFLAGTAKQNPYGWRDVVLNVNEVEAALASTRWAHQLDLPA